MSVSTAAAATATAITWSARTVHHLHAVARSSSSSAPPSPVDARKTASRGAATPTGTRRSGSGPKAPCARACAAHQPTRASTPSPTKQPAQNGEPGNVREVTAGKQTSMRPVAAMWLVYRNGRDPRRHLSSAIRSARAVSSQFRDAARYLHIQTFCSASRRRAAPRRPGVSRCFRGYVEWGTRIALHNSQPGADVVEHAPVSRWGWGVAPPYIP
jgi:hypothetical protein